MKLLLAAVGHLKSGPEKTLCDQYQQRLTWPFAVKEVVCKKSLSGEALKQAEADLLLQVIPVDSAVIALDERGESLTSQQFAKMIAQFQENSTKTLTFTIGGADGLSAKMRDRSSRLISFGQLTWPHMLVRVMLIEQLYRSQQILANHPYHRQ